MHARGASQWQSRRNMSFGPPVRRAHPASGATWNVQIVRGKMTSKCLWHACRALALGIILMLLGAGMATIGYYAEDLSVGQEIRGNATIRVKNESRGFHLNNLSYVGPIVMGVGGFIVVAACVMTFEARDSAAKVVPARFKISTSTRSTRTSSYSRRSTGTTSTSQAVGSQTNRWDHHLGVFKTSPNDASPQDRQALTAALIHFSKALRSPKKEIKPNAAVVSRSDSVPNLTYEDHYNDNRSNPTSPLGARKASTKQRRSRNNSIRTEKSNNLLRPGNLQLQRHTLSVDETASHHYRKSNDSTYGSECSMYLLDGQIVTHSDNPRIKERTRRSDTAKKHVLARQKPIERDELHSPKINSSIRRKNSTASDVSHLFRRPKRTPPPSSISQPAIDSKAIQTEISKCISPKSLKKTGQFLSTPSSVDHEYNKSQLSICTEPGVPSSSYPYSLSCQSSVPEESPENDKDIVTSLGATLTLGNVVDAGTLSCAMRPNSLILNCKMDNNSDNNSKTKHLYRSNSTRTYATNNSNNLIKPKLNTGLDEIYFISRNKDDENYDSIEVIDERRNKNFKKSVSIDLYSHNNITTNTDINISTTTTTTTTTITTNQQYDDIIQDINIDHNNSQFETMEVLDRNIKNNNEQLLSPAALNTKIENNLDEITENLQDINKSDATVEIMVDIEKCMENE